MSSQNSKRVRAAQYQTYTPHREQGLSLIELMVSLVVGLILVAAVFNMYTGNIRSARFTEGLQAIQENGRYGVSALQNGFRLAGYSPLSGSDGEIEAIDFSNSSASKLTIRSVQQYDCNGEDTTASNGLAVNTYALDTTTNELTCRGNQTNASEMPVIEGVEQFRVLYGIDEDSNPKTCEPHRYVPYSATLDSSQVVALRFAMLINSGSPIRTRSASETFVVLDQSYDSADDRFAREVFSGTVLLRNNINCTEI